MKASARRRRWLVIGLGGIGLVVGGTLLTRSDWLARRLAGLLEGRIEALTGEHASVGMVRLLPLDRAVRVEGLVLQHRSPRPELDGATIAAAEAVTLALGFEGLRPRLSRLELDRPTVHLHLDEGRLREFQGLPSSSGGPPAQRLPWDELYLRDGTLVLSAAWGGADLVDLRVEGLDATPGALADTMSVDAGSVSIAFGAFTQAASAVHIPDMAVSPARIHVPSLSLDFPDIDVDGAFEFEPQGDIAGLFTVSTRLEAWDPLMPPRLRLRGDVQADIELSGAAAAPVLGGLLQVDDLVLLVPRKVDPSLPPIHYGLGDVEVQLSVVERQLLVDPLVARWAGGTLRVQAAVDLASKGVWTSVSGADLQLAQALAALDVSPRPWVDLGIDLEVQAAGTLQPMRLAGSWTLAGRDLKAAGGPVPATPSLLAIPSIHARGQLDLDAEGIRLLARPLRTPRSSGRVDAWIGFGGRGPLDLQLDLDALDLRDLAPLGSTELAGMAELRARLAGPFNQLRLDGTTSIRAFRIWDLPFADLASSPVQSDLKRLSFPDVVARRGETPWRGRVEIDFRQPTSLDLLLKVGEGRLSDVLGVFVEIPGLESRMEGELRLQGPVDALDGEARVALRDVDLFGEHFDDGAGIGWMDDGRFTLDEAWLRRRGGLESLVARGTVGAGWAANIDLRSSAFRLEDLDLLQGLEGRLKGRLYLDAAVKGTLMELEPQGQLRLDEARLGQRSLDDSGLSFITRAGTMQFEGLVASQGRLLPVDRVDGRLDSASAEGRSRLSVAGSLGLWDAQPYAIDLEAEHFALDPLYPESPDGTPLSAQVSGEARVTGAFGDAPTPVSIAAHVDQTTLAWGRHQLAATGPWTWTQTGEDYALEGFEIQGGDTRLAISGQRQAHGLTRFSGGGQFSLDLLRMVVPGLERAEGLALVEIDGPTRDGRVRPEVKVELDEATLRGDWFPATFEDVRGELLLSPDEIRIDSASAGLGGGTIEGFGRIETEGFRPRSYDLRARVDEGRVRYFDWMPPAVGDAELAFTGPADSPLLSGRLDVHEMVFNERIDWESWVLEVSDEVLGGAVEEEGRDWFSMDLTMVAQDSIRIRNNVADMSASGELRVLGDTARPGLVGRVQAQPGGRVYLKEREFELLRGELRFVDPYSFDPDVDIALTTDVETRDQEYRIDAEVGGRWSDWRMETRSAPNLPTADINALLLFGMTREEMERSGALGQALAIEGSDVLVSSIGIVERAGEGVFRVRGLEPLLDPFRPDRLDLVSGTSERGSGEVSSALRLLYENDMADVGWRGGQLIFEQGISGSRESYFGIEQRLARRLYLRGWWSSEELERRLSIGGAYGLEVGLRWEIE